MTKKILLPILALGLILGGGFISWQSIHGTVTPEPKDFDSQIPITSGDNPQPGSSVHDVPVSPPVAAARAYLAAKLGIPVLQILVLRATEAEWPNGCLGLVQPGMMCTQAIVPGYEIEMKAGGKIYIFRTNESGSVIRFAD